MAGTDAVTVSLSDVAGATGDAGFVTVTVSYSEGPLNLGVGVDRNGWRCHMASGRQVQCTTAAKAGRLPVIRVSRLSVLSPPDVSVTVTGDKVTAVTATA